MKGPEAVCVSGPGGVRVGKTIGYMYKGTFYHTYHQRFRQPVLVRYSSGQRRSDENNGENKQNNAVVKVSEKNGNRQATADNKGGKAVTTAEKADGKPV